MLQASDGTWARPHSEYRRDLPTRATLPDRLVFPTSALPVRFYRKRMVLKANQLTIMVNDMMRELEVHRTPVGFGRAGEYGHFGYDDSANGKTLSAEGLAVRLGRLMSPCVCMPESEPRSPSLERF